MLCPSALILYFDMINRLFTSVFLLFFATCTQAQILVIGNLAGIKSLSATQVEDVFMGRMRSLSNGRLATPVDYSALRAEFYQKLLSSPIEQVDAYWARILFTGLASAPIKLFNNEDVIKNVTENIDAIGYIDAENVKIAIINKDTIGIYKKDTKKKVRILLTLN
jgi:hypothetical protein